METRIAVLNGKDIRKILFQNEWYFSVVDIVAALTDSVNHRNYWYRMKQGEKQSNGFKLSTLCRQLETGIGKRVVTSENYLSEPESRKRLKAQY